MDDEHMIADSIVSIHLYQCYQTKRVLLFSLHVCRQIKWGGESWAANNRHVFGHSDKISAAIRTSLSYALLHESVLLLSFFNA